MPIAILALEKLNENRLLDRNTTYKIENDSVASTFAKDIIDIFAVSSNEAYNRLFEFLGPDDINKRLNDKGISGRISHRLSVPNSDALITKPLFFYNEKDVIFTTEPSINQPIVSLNLKKIQKGIGYTIGDSLIKNPLDFSKKKYMPINSLHGILKRLIFPEYYPKEQQFQLTENADFS